MSFKSITREARTKADIKYESDTRGAGAQLTKTWKMRYHDVMGRLESLKTKREALYFGKQTVFAEYVFIMDYRSGILITDRLFIEGRQFNIKFIKEQFGKKRRLLIALEEYKG